MDILHSCVEVLSKSYPQTPIFVDKVKQAKNLPCFFIKLGQEELKRDLGDYYWLSPCIEVCYYSDLGSGNEELSKIAGELDLALQVLFGIKGQKQNQLIEAGKLQVNWQYPYRCKLGKVLVEQKMESLEKLKIQLGTGWSLSE